MQKDLSPDFTAGDCLYFSNGNVRKAMLAGRRFSVCQQVKVVLCTSEWCGEEFDRRALDPDGYFDIDPWCLVACEAGVDTNNLRHRYDISYSPRTIYRIAESIFTVNGTQPPDGYGHWKPDYSKEGEKIWSREWINMGVVP